MTSGAGPMSTPSTQSTLSTVGLDDIVEAVVAGASQPGSVHVVVVPGGASHLVTHRLVAALVGQGIHTREIVCNRSGPTLGSTFVPDDSGAQGPVTVVGEAQWAGDQLIELLDLVERGDGGVPLSVVLVQREVPIERALGLAHQAARRRGTVSVLGPASVDQVVRAHRVSAAEAERAVAVTGGRLDLLAAFFDDGDLDLDVRARLGLVDDAARRVAELLAFGAEPSDLPDLFDASGGSVDAPGVPTVGDELGDTVDRALGALLVEGVLSGGQMVDGVSAAVRRLTPPTRRSVVIDRLSRASHLTLDLASRLLALADRSPAAAAAYARAAELVADADPATAAELVAAAAAAGADRRTVAIPAAVAALASGDARAALAALAGIDHDSGSVAGGVEVDADVAECAALMAAAWIAVGDPEAAVPSLLRSHHPLLACWTSAGLGNESTIDALTVVAPTAATADSALADAVASWLDGRADDCLDAIDTAVRRAGVDGVAERRPISIDAAAAIMHERYGDLDEANRLVVSALGERAGGSIHRRSLLAMAAWVAARRGHLDDAAHAIVHDVPATLSPSDAVWLAGARCAVAIRRADADGLDEAAAAAAAALAACPGHLHHVAPLTDIAGAIARSGLTVRDPLAAPMRAATRLGRPAVLVDLAWARLSAAMSSDDGGRIAVCARGFVDVVETPALADRPDLTPRLAAARCLATNDSGDAGDAGDVDAAVVERVATELAAAGWLHEAARLCGVIAMTSRRENDGRRLLKRSRALRGERTQLRRTQTADRTVVRLSDQEERVAQMVLDGHTHRSIGSALFISAKTVEHHVAHIRTKLGATNRAEMLAAIRTYLDGNRPS